MKREKGLIEKVCKKFIILIKIQQKDKNTKAQYPDLFEKKTFTSALGSSLTALTARLFDKEPKDTSWSH